MKRVQKVLSVGVVATLAVTGGAFAGSSPLLVVPTDYLTIQEALDAAPHNAHIRVMPGIYPEAINFLGKRVRLYSLEGPGVTIIDGTGQDASVVTAATNEGPGTSLEGFTIRGGVGTWIGPSFQLKAGGGMFIVEASPTLSGNVFEGNTADFGGAIAILSAGWSLPKPTVIGTKFLGNRARIEGGAIFANSPLEVIYGEFYRNASLKGGALAVEDANVLITNSLVVENRARYGSGIWSADTDLDVGNVTFTGNVAHEMNTGALHVHGVGNVTVYNSILWGDTGGEIGNTAPAFLKVMYSDVQGGWPGEGNLDVDPEFYDHEIGNYRLMAGSPCADAAANKAVTLDMHDLDGDDDKSECLPFDLDGAARFADDASKFDDGCGYPVIVDMGPYEVAGKSAHPMLPTDVNGDRAVDFADMLLVLSSWGACPEPCCAADVDFNGIVDFRDVLRVLADWRGPPSSL